MLSGGRPRAAVAGATDGAAAGGCRCHLGGTYPPGHATDRSPPRSVAVTVQFELNGRQADLDDDGRSLLEVLRDDFDDHSVKDGCSPQGQCGCCTVLVDGAPRVSCVTPARRVAGRRVTTLVGLDDERRRCWAD